MRRIRIVLSYDGTAYHGWQVQPGFSTIQAEVERVVSEIEKSPVRVHASGRTDAGVHAIAQTAAFDIRNPIPCENLRRAINRLLPPDIRIITVIEAAPDFHPRFNAIGKHYEYRIFREEICPPFERRYVHHYPYPLDELAMATAARAFLGDHDFTSFAAADEKDALGYSKRRRIFLSTLERIGPNLIYRVEGSGFLKHMVRNMVGTLLEVGKGNLTAVDLARFLTNPPAGKAGPTAPASGLFLVHVEYPPPEAV